VQQPAAALATLREKHLAEKHIAWKGEPSEMPTHTFEVDAAMPPEAGWKLTQAGGSYTLIGYDVARQEVFVDRTHSGGDGFSKDFPARTGAPLPHPAGALRWQIVVDRNSVEVFADGGRVAITNLIFPSPGPFRVETYLNGGKATPPSVDAWTLKSIW
jgi:sucrose-6-phosphate hydrolase SacC (GH32 family)